MPPKGTPGPRPLPAGAATRVNVSARLNPQVYVALATVAAIDPKKLLGSMRSPSVTGPLIMPSFDADAVQPISTREDRILLSRD